MTVKEAFDGWERDTAPDGCDATVRKAFRNVLGEFYDHEVKFFGGELVRNIFAQSKKDGDTVRSAEKTLYDVLCWGWFHGYCPRPSFGERTSRQEGGKGHGHGPWKRAVVQLDAGLLEVKRFESGEQAVRETGLTSLKRACRTHELLYGKWFFAYADEYDAGGWKPSPFMPKVPLAMDKKDVPVISVPSLSGFSDEDLKDELTRRGWQGSLYKRLDF